MGLFTKEIEAALERQPLYSQDGKGRKANVICKLFLPGTAWTWYVLEGNRCQVDEATAKDAGLKAGPSWDLFGVVCSPLNPKGEYGYFLLAELEAIRAKAPIEDEAGRVLGHISQEVELDTHFTARILEEVDGLGR